MNPFSYGGIVSGDYFFNRLNEIEQLKIDLKNNNNVILYAPRKYGKTSLVNKVLNELETENYNTIYLDFFNVIDRNKFIEIYAQKLLKKKKLTLNEAIKSFKQFVTNLSPTVKFDNLGNPSFEITVKENNKDSSFEEVVNLPEKWGSEKEKWIIVFDEFQEINKLNGDNFEKELRSFIQFHQNVTYLFLGSKTHMLLNMFRDKKRAFYNIGKYFKLEKIGNNEYRKFIVSNFNKFDITISENQIGYILMVTEGIPFYVQFLSSELWQNVIATKKKVENEDIDLAIKNIIFSQTDYYLELFNKLSQYQKKLLLALKQNGKEIYSKKYSDAFGLSSASSTQRALEKLIDEGLVEKENDEILFSDPFFKQFLELKFN